MTTTVERDAVIVSGVDAGGYLQTQLTQDVLALEPGSCAWTFLLNSKSGVIALMSIARSAENTYTLEVEPGWGDIVRQTIDEFLGRMDVSFQQATLSVEEEKEQDRIARGWPRMGREIDQAITPAMTGIVPETISFNKGCYTGQEFVARVHYRGTAPPKRLVRFETPGSVCLEPGSIVTVKGENVGTVTSAVDGSALVYLKRGVETPTNGLAGDVNVHIRDLHTT